ncbi:MAG: ATP-dependent helicase HrpB [Akkermansia muciniphila]
MVFSSLPIEEIRGELMEALRVPSPRILLKAPTGSGKSTGVPPMMDDAGLGDRGLIVVVQPRRMAARLLARHVARLRGVELGKEVGYAVRFERYISSRTRIAYVTDGMLERWLTEWPSLEGVSAVVFDEFHERSLSGDLSLGRVLDLQEGPRWDLAVVVMSATLEISGLREYMGGSCRVLEAQGRQYPVEVVYWAPRLVSDGRGRVAPPPIWEQAADVVREAVREDDCGDVLVFMPGVYEIRKTVELLAGKPWMSGRDVFPLYGSLAPEQQNCAVERGDIPRVIVSTNVAETSLTIEGVRTVVDSGLVRRSGWDPYRGMDTLHLVKISKASAAQRAGRAGRVAPGRCFRLWSEAEQARKEDFDPPECFRVDLAGAVLNLAAWGVTVPENFRWLDVPAPLVMQRAVNLLAALGATEEDGSLTDTGKRMTAFPLPPRLARLMVAGQDEQCAVELAAVAALMQGEGVAVKGGLNDHLRDSADYTDFQAEWRAVEKAVDAGFGAAACTRWGISSRGAREAWMAYRQLLSVGSRGKARETPGPDFTAARPAVVRAMIESFADHVGVRNGVAANTCRMAGGVGGRLAEGSVVFQGEHFVAAEVAELSGKAVETRVGRCTLIAPEDLRSIWPERFSCGEEAVFDAALRRVRLHRKLMYGDLVLEDRDRGDAPTELAAPVLAEKVVDGTLKLVKWNDAVEQWIRRLNGLSVWMPELELPRFSEEDKLVAISLVCEGAVGYKDIKEREIIPVLRDWLSGWQAKALDDYAPVSLTLPNGQHAKVRYGVDSSPVISLTVQRLFGVAVSPRIANGAVPVIVEVLAPSQRPWQVTGSLESFWRNGYGQMKKDLAGRYPRHRWPDPGELDFLPRSR